VNQPVDLDSDDVLDLPAELLMPNQINVGSVTLEDAYRKDKVSFGTTTYHLAAPSEKMPVLAFSGAGASFPGGPINDGIDTDNAGNSLAAPQVSGTLALMLSVNNGLRGRATELKNRLLESATAIGGLNNKVGNGRRLNVHAAVQRAQQP
jgi:subtilisin family serine protease